MVQDLKAKYEGLPEDVRKAVDSNDIPQKLQDIGLSHGLHIDQIGILEEETALVMLGVSHPDSFVERIEERLKISGEKAIDIATDVNIRIFLSIRKSLMKMHEVESESSKNEGKIDSREDILAEIEDKPEPPKSEPIAIPVSKPQNIAAPKEQVAATHDFIAQRVAGTATTPVQKAAIDLKPKAPETPKSYAADPYREPLN